MNRIPSVVWRSLAFLAITAIVLFYTMESKGFEDCIRSRDNEASKKESGPFLVLVPRPLTCTVRVFDKHNGTLVALFTLTLWFTTQATLAHFRREFLVTHRPKLTIRQVAFLPNSNDPAIEFTLVNTGESTATIIESSVKPWIFAIAGEWPPVPPYDPEPKHSRTANRFGGRKPINRPMPICLSGTSRTTNWKPCCSATSCMPTTTERDGESDSVVGAFPAPIGLFPPTILTMSTPTNAPASAPSSAKDATPRRHKVTVICTLPE